jgi:lipid II:glycine glycyltransferase (peptidoglycan interpeptide bridge formation enzyme)
MLLTRRRHGLVPQPLEWFQNLAASLQSQLRVRVVSKFGTPVASVLTLSHRDQVTYKYGCSDARFHATGAMPFLLWTVIRDAKACGMQALDLGRSDLDDAGLVRFKDRFGATRSDLKYLRHPMDSGRPLQWLRPPLKRVVSRLPDRVMALAGNRLYGHFG